MTLKYPDDKYVGKAEDVVLEPAQVAVVCIGAVNIIIIWLSRHWQWEGGGGWTPCHHLANCNYDHPVQVNGDEGWGVSDLTNNESGGLSKFSLL